MKVIRAEAMGLCFGVRDALAIVEQVPQPQLVAIHGELVHNPIVIDRLQNNGYLQYSESARHGNIDRPLVMITAHGVSDKERARLNSLGKQLIDTTCPLVRRVHESAQQLAADGYFVVVIGKRGHVEVQGIVEDLVDYEVLLAPSEVRDFNAPKIGVVCQSTTASEIAEDLVREIRRLNPQAEVKYIDTICHPTKDRQRALTNLLKQVDAMIVVGGKNSNNTKELVRRCEESRVPAHHVQSANEIDESWFEGVHTVGLTAGTSTLDATIEDVYNCLVNIDVQSSCSGNLTPCLSATRK